MKPYDDINDYYAYQLIEKVIEQVDNGTHGDWDKLIKAVNVLNEKIKQFN